MSAADELLKYKEMLEQGIISPEEFKTVKNRLMSDSPTATPNDARVATSEPETIPTPGKKKSNKKLFTVIGCIILVIAAIFGVIKIKDISEANAAKKAIAEKVAPILAEYGIEDFSIKGSGYFFKIMCEDYDDLSNKEKLECLVKLDKIDSVKTSKGETINLSSCDVYVSPSGYYYRVTTAQVVYMGTYNTAGLYYSDGGGRRCVYEKDN